MIHVGHALEVLKTLPENSIQMIVTSPPYWGLRDYGMPPLVWDGEPDHEHVWTESVNQTLSGGGYSDKSTLQGYTSENTKGRQMQKERDGKREITMTSVFCDCGAWRGCLGLEPTPDLFIEHLRQIFSEGRRVLKPDGTLWLNLGDSYANTGVTDVSKVGGFTGKAIRKTIAAGGEKQGGWQDSRPRKIPEGVKPKDLIGIPWMAAFALRADGWFLRSDIIWSKCLSGGAWVYARTQKGEMPVMVKDLGRLAPSTVQLWNGGAWTSVSEMRRTHDRDGALEIELRNGERIGCTPEHRWPTARGLVEARHLVVGDVVDATILPEPIDPRRPSGLDDDLVGWFVGTYLADGSMSGETIQIASGDHETERLKRLREMAVAFDGSCHVHRTSARGMTINLEGRVLVGILGAYVGGRTAPDKHLATRCWMRSNVFLRAVLDGYLQGDGHNVGGRGRWVLGFCANDALARDLRVVAARLDVSLRLRRTMHTLRGRSFPGWRGSLYIDAGRRHRPDTEIVAIRRSRARRFWEITVADEPRVFALGCGVLTHNSNPMPESITDRPTKSHEYIFLMAKSSTYYYDDAAIREDSVGKWNSKESLSGFDPDSKNALMIDQGIRTRGGNTFHRDEDRTGRNRRSVWTIANESYSGSHFATFSISLPLLCIQAGSKIGDTVMDPFTGSGTVGLAAKHLGREFVGIELNPEYAELAEKRIKRMTLKSTKKSSSIGPTFFD